MTQPLTTKQLARVADSAGKSMRDIHQCVVCGADLAPARDHVDTCGERCYRRLLAHQRGQEDCVETQALVKGP